MASLAGRRFCLWGVLMISIMMLIPGRGHAQTGAGSIQGTVMDSTGAVIQGAAIQVTNLATGVVSNTTSNGAGFYQVPSLFVGTYSLRVSSPKMETYKTSIELQVGQTAVINPSLKPGDVATAVVVSADEVQLTSPDNATLSSTLENERIQQLPMDGRNLQSLIGLATPGMEGTSGKVNGLAVEAMTYTVDGVATRADNDGSSTSTTLLPDPDSVQEVRMETANSSARFSTPATAIITTKSGTNKVHGTFFETARNNAFGVARARQDAVGVPAPHYVRNEFGASAGGPIVLPHIYNGKNKSFWFFAYERFSLANSTTSLDTVPTDAMRNGDFSGLVNAKGALQVQFDPSTTKANSACPVPVAGATYTTKGTTNNPYCRTPYFGTSYAGVPNTINVIPKSLESPTARIYYQLMPEPSADLANVNPLVSPNRRSLDPNLFITSHYAFRLDHHFSEKDSTFLSFVKNQTAINTTNTMANLPVSQDSVNIPAGAAFGFSNKPQSTFIAALGHTHVFSPTFYSETSLNAQWFHSYGVPGVASGQDFESMLGLPNNFGQPGMPTFCGSCIKGLTSSQNGNSSAAQRSFNLAENLSKTNGKHQVQFGGEYRYAVNSNKPVGVPDKIPYGAIATGLYQPTSGKNYTAYASTGFTDVSMFLGLPNNYNINLQAPHVVYHVTGAAAYVQDDYHITPHLTANIGLRYEARPGLLTMGGITDTFDLKNDALVLGAPIQTLIAKGYTTQAIINNDQQIGVKFETPQQAGMPNGLMRSYDLNFLPRLGLSYQTQWGTVLHGAYGRYLQINPLQDFVNHPQQNNPFTASYTQSYNTADQAIDALPNEYIRYNGPVKFPVAGLNSSNVVNSSSTTSILPGITGFYSDPNWAPTAASTTNFTVEQPVGRSVVRASWVWTHSTNLDTTLMFNAAPSDYQWFMATGRAKPTGGASVIGTPQQNTYAATAEGPYDQTTWGTVATAAGGNSWHTRAGWSNYNALQATYQRLYHHGYAYQLMYVFGKTLRAGGNSNDGNNLILPFANYPEVLGTNGTMSLLAGSAAPFIGAAAPGAPQGIPNWGMTHDLMKYELYQLDSSTPTMHIRFNWVVDLPVGKGRKFFGNSPRWLDEIIGGFQLAGSGDIHSNLIQPASGNWGAVSKLKIYKHKAPITDCRSGACYKEDLWFNGYLQSTVLDSNGCTANCISGMPSDYTPIQSPLITNPTDPNFGTNTVTVKLLDGTTQTVQYDGGPAGGSYLEKTYLHGPVNWPINASLFKVFRITEKGTTLRVNLDAFNVFNMPGETDPAGEGVQSFLKNAASNPPRTLQITARLSF